VLKVSGNKSFLFSLPEPTPGNISSCAIRLFVHLILSIITGGLWLVFVFMMALSPKNERRMKK